MAFNFYNNYMNHIAQPPSQQYYNDRQAQLNDQWENTTQVRVVQEQNSIGSKIYNPIEVQVSEYVDYSSVGRKNTDDFIKMGFQSIKHNPIMGLYYQYEDNYWITIGVGKHMSVTQDIAVRRCNNVLTWVNPLNGAILTYPCVLDYNAQSPKEQKTKSIITPNNHIVAIVQGNADTILLSQNQRFIINGRPWKLSGYNDYMQLDMVTKDTTLLYFDLYLDEKQPTDDYENGIANRYEYIYSIDILTDTTEQVKGFVGNMVANVYFNGEIVNRPIVWKSNTNANIDLNGEYVITGETGTTAIITAEIQGNESVSSSVTIDIVSSITNKSYIALSPLYEQVRIGQPIRFTAILYTNGVSMSAPVTVSASGASTSCYTLVQNGNEFILTCDKISATPLTLTFNAGQTTLIHSIKLSAVF